jgi:hypothetical protein
MYRRLFIDMFLCPLRDTLSQSKKTGNSDTDAQEYKRKQGVSETERYCTGRRVRVLI